LNSARGCPELGLKIDKSNIRLRSQQAELLREEAIQVLEGIKAFSSPKQLSTGRRERSSDCTLGY